MVCMGSPPGGREAIFPGTNLRWKCIGVAEVVVDAVGVEVVAVVAVVSGVVVELGVWIGGRYNSTSPRTPKKLSSQETPHGRRDTSAGFGH
jgi:hypothetical protein